MAFKDEDISEFYKDVVLRPVQGLDFTDPLSRMDHVFGEGLNIVFNYFYLQRRLEAIENFPILQDDKIKILLKGKKNWHKKGKAIPVLLSGGSIRDAVQASGLSRQAAMMLARDIRHTFLPRCECGRFPGHSGWCRPRLKNSSKRKKFLKERWNKNVQ